MKRIILIAIALSTAAVFAAAQEPPADPDGSSPFIAMDVYIDSGARPLAAYQFELTATGDARIVGVEGGEHPAFAEPPYYDPAALQQGRIIIAAFDTGDDLPVGRTRVARVHLWTGGDRRPTFNAKLIVAGSTDGEEISCTITVTEGNG